MLKPNLKKRILILYTTLYREGGAQFHRAAQTMLEEKIILFPDHHVEANSVETKAAFIKEINRIIEEDSEISELHFIGHSGMYGIMLGTTKWPEQLSPFEWKQLKIPFGEKGKAFFHACRSGRWFAPFFMRTFGVTTYGYFWYTTVSKSPDYFSWAFSNNKQNPLYIISTSGKKSHGLIGLLKKHLMKNHAFPMIEFLPTQKAVDTSYDSVAHLYDQTFENIAVRDDELSWLRKNLDQLHAPKILDIGCGTGSFLRGIRNSVDEAHGVDLSSQMITYAAKRSESDPKLYFKKINGPQLPYPDNSFDVVTSVLSFRYLDWDPITKEILRVLKPGGRLMVIDMVASPVKFCEWPHFLYDKVRRYILLSKNKSFRQALTKMVNDPQWKLMLEYNPIRAEHEFKWYLQSRFPGGGTETINYAWNSRILAFSSAPIYHKTIAEMTYP